MKSNCSDPAAGSLLNSRALSHILSASGAACLYRENTSGTWLASPGLAARLGRDAGWSEWENDTFSQLLHGEDSFEFISFLEALKPDSTQAPIQLRLRHASGDWRHFSAHATLCDESTVVVFTDLTQTLQTESALIDSQMRLRGLYDAAPVSILLWNRDGRITDWNRMAATVFGYDRNTAVGMKLVPALIHPDEYQRFSASVSAALEQNTEVQLTCRSLDHAGQEMRCEWHTVPLRNPRGSLVGLFSIALDVTQKEAAAEAILHAKEEAERLSAAKTEFLATISHELKTPLNGVLGMAQVIEFTRAEDAELQGHVRTISASGQRLLAIVEAILAYTAIDLQPPRPAGASFQPRKLCAVLEGRSIVEAEKKGLDCHFDYQALNELNLPGQQADLEQILSRLLDNALDFTERGGISFSARLSADSPPRVVFTITDSGCGIPAEFMPQLFTPFRQASSGFNRKHEGLGMGLATARKLAEYIGAELSLSSPPGQGVTATLSVPGA